MDQIELAKARLPPGTLMPVLPWAALSIFACITVPHMVRGASFPEIFPVATISALVGVVVIGGILLFCEFTFPVTVYTSGISSYNPWGSWKREFMHWQVMAEIQQTRVLGVSYLRVCSLENQSIWIPRRALAISSLVFSIGQAAPQGNPILRFIPPAA